MSDGAGRASGISAEPRHPIRRRWYDVVLDGLAIAGVIALLGFPIAAIASVSEPTLGVAAPAAPSPHLRATAATAPRRDVPGFAPDGLAHRALAGGQLPDRPALAELIAQQAQVVFGPGGDGGLLAAAHGCFTFPCDLPDTGQTFVGQEGGYPLRFAGIDRVLDRTIGPAPLTAERSAAATDLAGLLMLAGSAYPGDYFKAGTIAYALVDRARAGGGCDAQLDFAVLTTGLEGDAYPRAVAEYQQADRLCPGDPTPRWLLGQYQSAAAPIGVAAATFHELEHRIPGSPLGWSGAADALVRDGIRSTVGAPFTARDDFRRAVDGYRRAQALAPDDPDLLAGEARARAGLGDFARAIALDRAAMARKGPDQGRLTNRLADDLEGAARAATTASERRHLFVQAAQAAQGPADATRFGITLVPTPARSDPAFDATGATEPISIGASRSVSTHLTPGVLGLNVLAFTGAVEDISFIPQFRQLGGFTGRGACRATRDLLLAGRSVPAPTGADPSCSQLAQIAAYEVTLPAKPDPGVLEHQQDLWRFGGDLTRARTAAERWMGARPQEPQAADRAGEIAYLQRDYDRAATFFGQAVERARQADPTKVPNCTSAGDRIIAQMVADEQLKQGTALEMSGRLAAATRMLTEADHAASALLPTAGSPSPAAFDTPSDCGAAVNATFTSYNARLQLGDTALRSHTKEMDEAESREIFERAERAYRAARMRIPAPELGFRPEVLDNNEALVLVRLHRPADALHAIGRALHRDQHNPVFLENRAYIEEQLGHHHLAAAHYTAALRADPSAYQAANDLGVLLAEDGHLEQAAAMFRHAIAAQREYAVPAVGSGDSGRAYRDTRALHPRDAPATGYPTGEFNLGIVLDRMGPTHLLEAQGELAAARRADPELREHGHEFIRDDETVFTTLDLSKPLPPEWHLAASQQTAPIAVGGIALAILLAAMFRAVVEDKVKEKAEEEALEVEERFLGRARIFSERIPAVVAVVAVVAVFAYPLTQSTGTTRADYVLIGSGVAITTFAFMRLRSALARRAGIHAGHYPFLPALVVGGAATLLTGGYAPMPATKHHDAIPASARWIATGLLATLTLALLVIGRFSGVPLATDLGVAALVMTASTLVPVKPFDGAYLERRHLGLIIGLALAVIAVLVEQRIL